MRGVAIRRAGPADLPVVLRLLRALAPPGEPASDPERAARTFARLAEYPDYAVYVAEDAGAVVGTFSLLVMDNLAHGGAPAGIVENVVVEEMRRGRGIGRTMMRFAMDRCAEAGCYKLVLSSNLRREAAHRFYEDLGIVQHGLSFSVPIGGREGDAVHSVAPRHRAKGRP